MPLCLDVAELDRVDQETELELASAASGAGVSAVARVPLEQVLREECTERGILCEQLLDFGSHGKVYKGRYNSTDVAIKVLLSSSSDEVFQSLSMKHPSVVSTHRHFQLPKCQVDEHGQHYGGENVLVQELCETSVLAGMFAREFFQDRGGIPNLAACLQVLRDVAAGLQYVHEQGFCHADLKPANVLLITTPEGRRAKIADFSCSLSLCVSHPADEVPRPGSGGVGTITHMSPEVLAGQRPGVASDVFAFGVMMYELFTGQQAYPAYKLSAIRDGVMTGHLRPDPFPAHVPGEYEALARLCWSQSPEDRPCVEDLRCRLDSLLSRSVQLQADISASLQPMLSLWM